MYSILRYLSVCWRRRIEHVNLSDGRRQQRAPRTAQHPQLPGGVPGTSWGPGSSTHVTSLLQTACCLPWCPEHTPCVLHLLARSLFSPHFSAALQDFLPWAECVFKLFSIRPHIMTEKVHKPLLNMLPENFKASGVGENKWSWGKQHATATISANIFQKCAITLRIYCNLQIIVNACKCSSEKKSLWIICKKPPRVGLRISRYFFWRGTVQQK